VLYAPVRPLPRLLVLGAGLDAVAVVDLARRLGWRVTVADHRQGYLSRGDLGAADQVLQVTPADLASRVNLRSYAAAVVMSHHLATDRLYLQAVARSPVPYLGLLGPAARRERLLADLGPTGDSLRTRLRSPIGLPIGADSPETIALSILAEIQATLAGPADSMAAGD
jgi:xanthine/CO dehydrogenase XdhC/CoxF family maturation factor